MKTTREKIWKLAVAGLLLVLLTLSVQLWRARSSERYYANLTRQAVAQMQQQVQGTGNLLVAKNVPVPCFW